MKESVTKFDLDAAFKALDDIAVPVSEKGIKANRPALTEIFSRKSKFETLFEEYYDINNANELNDAKDTQEAEIAKAKLARIEKIVDLDAKSPEDLLTSYVGKYIIQCPQCMTLFYKDKEDVIGSDEDPNTVNVGEVCQHCGNESGYTLVGKVGEAEEEAPAEETAEPAEEVTAEEPTEETSEEEAGEEAAEETSDDLGDLDALDLNLDEEPTEEKTEESFTIHTGETLVEEVDANLDAQLKAHNEYIEYVKAMIKQEEEALKRCDNEFVKKSIERRLNDYKADLEAALPDAVKEVINTELPTPEEAGIEESESEETTEKQEESLEVTGTALTESLTEDADLDVSADEFKELIDSPEFKKPISDVAVRAMLNSEKDEKATETNEALEEGIFDKIKDKVADVKSKVTKFIDDQIKTRASSADWILKNALIDYAKATTKDDGSVESADSNKKFKNFLILGYMDTDSEGDAITVAPEPDDKTLVKGMKYPEIKQKYADAENIAKGWSMSAGNGPAAIYLAKDDSGKDVAFLCQYFKGKLDERTDQLEKYIEIVKSSILGAKKMQKGGVDQSDISELTADKLKAGAKIKTQNGTEVEVTKIEKTSDPLTGKEQYEITFNIDDKPVVKAYDATQKFNIVRSSITTESLSVIMNNIDELNESALETLISNSLIESYGNVAGFKLTECACLNDNFTVDGTIYFTSGNARKTTYRFVEGCLNKNKVQLQGLNEKLGADKQFVLSGRTDNKNFIAESFKQIKK